MEMPIQSLGSAPSKRLQPASAPPGIALRRCCVIGGAIAMTVAGGNEMYFVLNSNGPNALGILVLFLFVALFAWIALAFTSAVSGLLSVVYSAGIGLGIQSDGPLPALRSRTAVLMPTYNESPARVFSGVETIYESLRATGQLAQFDMFILSDTTDPDIWVAEEAAFLALRDRTDGQGQIFYRRRQRNTARKAGNLSEWVCRFGGAYQQMLVLDADSLMEGDTIVRITDAMERSPDVGLIQTLPIVVNGTTLFARMQQFAGRVYGPVIAHGIASWHGSEGNYWGHNAVIRIQAFAEQAGLPVLLGRTPFGGHILSHDFVEAALMRRGGWAIHMVPGLGGSFEEGPPSLTDVAIRDRRWCQGNLQHAAVLPARGLHWVSRLHLLMGIGSYITSPLWLIFLLAGVLISLRSRFVRLEYFGTEKSLFPQWPDVDPVRAKWVFIGTMTVLLAPKLLAYIAMLCNSQLRRGCGGAVRGFASLLIETLLGGLIAPIAMLIQTTGVTAVLLGRDSGWNAQRREDGGVSILQVWAGYWGYMVFGLLLAAAAFAVSTSLFFWMLPVWVGLVMAVPLAAGTSTRGAGQALRRNGLLCIPEEIDPPTTLVRAGAIFDSLKGDHTIDGVERLMNDPILMQWHCAMLPAGLDRKAPIDVHLVVGLAKLARADTLDEAVGSLSLSEKVAILGSREGLDRLQSFRKPCLAPYIGASMPMRVDHR